MRTFPFAAIAAALVLALFGVLLGAGNQRATGRKADLEAAAAAQRASDELAGFFDRTRSVALIASQNPALRDVFDDPGPTSLIARRAAGGRSLDRSNATLRYLETLFPKSVGEACVIHVGGVEVARAVEGRRAPLADLSNDESEAPFFRGAVDSAVGQVSHSAPYVSGDTGLWVIANSAPFGTRRFPKAAFLHYEISVESLRSELAASTAVPLQVVDLETGRVVIDTRLRQDEGAPLGRGEAPASAPLTGDAQGGTVTAEGHRAAWRRVPADAGNQNRWGVLAVSAQPAAMGLGGLGTTAWFVFAAAVLLATAGVRGLGVARARVRRDRAAEEERTRLQEERRASEAEALRLGEEARERSLRLQEIITEVAEGAGGVAGAARQIEDHAAQSGEVLETIERALAELHRGVEEQRETVVGALGTAEAGRATAVDGLAASHRAGEAMERVRTTSQELARVVADLGDRSRRIGSIVDTMSDIASQTGLLALNAAIEAARAGEHGQGFAVVAQEVASLARESQSSAEDIARLVADIQQATGAAVERCERTLEEVAGGVGTSQEANLAFAGLSASIEEIAAALDALSGLAERSAESAAQVEETSRMSSAVISQTLAASEELSATAESLAGLATGR